MRSAYKWLARYRAQGQAGLQDRSSRPHRSPTRTATGAGGGDPRPAPPADHRPGDRRPSGSGAATVSAVLRRAGLGRLRAWTPRARPPLRARPPGGAGAHRRQEAGAIGAWGIGCTGICQGRVRGAGWEYVHSRWTTPPAWPTPRCCPTSARRPVCAFLRRAVAWWGPRASRWSAYSPTMARHISRAWPRPPARSSGLAPKRTRALPPADQRQGRALHPDPHPPLGLRPDYGVLGRAHRGAGRLAAHPTITSDPTAASTARRRPNGWRGS